jgi:hypothetical protein
MRAIERKVMLEKIFGDNTIEKSVDIQIEAILIEMNTQDGASEEYQRNLGYLERLSQVKTEQRRSMVSRDTVAMIAGNLAGILLIIVYEQKHVMTSKGFNQLIRPS